MMLYYAKLFDTKGGKYLYDAKCNTLELIPDSIYSVLKLETMTSNMIDVYNEYVNHHLIRNVLNEPADVELDHHWNEARFRGQIDCHRKLLILSITNMCNMNCNYYIYNSKFSQEENINHSISFDLA